MKKNSIVKKSLKNIFVVALFVAIGFCANCDEVDDIVELEEQEFYQQFDDYERSQLSNEGKVLNIVTSTWDYNLDPHTASFSSEALVLTGLYEGLFTYNPRTLACEYALCESYNISRNKKRWTFKIRQDAEFSNGEKITAQSFKIAWLNLLSNPNAQFASFADCIEGAREYRTGKGRKDDVRIVVEDKYTLTVYLTEPTEHLPNLLCHHSFAAVNKRKGIYSGPYVLSSYENNTIVLEKNANYWDAKKVLIPTICFTCSDDFEENVYRYNMGEVDWLTTAGGTDRLIDTDDIKLNAEFGTEYLFFKERKNVWSNVKMRQALAEAFPYKEARKNYYMEAETLIFPLSGYPEVTGYTDTNMNDAVDLMIKARNELGIALDTQLYLKVAVPSDDETMVEIAKSLIDAWGPLGVIVEIEGVPYSQYNYSIAEWDADIFVYGWVGDYADPLAFLELFKTGSSLNVAKYSNETFDSYLQQASTAESSSQHYSLLSKAEQILIDEFEVIPLSHFVASNVINTEIIGGWYTNALDLHPLKYLFIRERKMDVDDII